MSILLLFFALGTDGVQAGEAGLQVFHYSERDRRSELEHLKRTKNWRVDQYAPEEPATPVGTFDCADLAQLKPNRPVPVPEAAPSLLSVANLSAGRKLAPDETITVPQSVFRACQLDSALKGLEAAFEQDSEPPPAPVQTPKHSELVFEKKKSSPKKPKPKPKPTQEAPPEAPPASLP